MPRDPRAELERPAYLANRLVRSSVEREFIIIGEVPAAISRRAPELFASVEHARRIIDVRNQLTDLALTDTVHVP